MRLAFSTLGCPGWTIDQILDCASRCRFDGVEIRGILSEMDLPNSVPFGTEFRFETARRFHDKSIDVACISSSVRLCTPDDGEAARQIEDGMANVLLAADVGSKLVRVFGGRIPEGMTREQGNERAAAVLRQLGNFAHEHGVTVVQETHDDFIASEDVAAVLTLADSPGAAALWDINHPYRFKGEQPETTIANLGSHIKHVHVKDSVEGPNPYKLTGEGTLPIPDMLRLLKRVGYDGYLSLEWEKRWIPELEEPEAAFPHYASTIRTMLSEVEDA